jgi:hypothetical protein
MKQYKNNKTSTLVRSQKKRWRRSSTKDELIDDDDDDDDDNIDDDDDNDNDNDDDVKVEYSWGYICHQT